MSIEDTSEFEGIEKPELFFGIAAALGAPLHSFQAVIESAVRGRGYDVEVVHLSNFLNAFKLPTPPPPTGADEYTRVRTLMDRGNELRKQSGGSEALAGLFAAHVNAQRPTKKPRTLSGKAFVLRQLKHPDEVYWLRHIYGPAFHLIGLYAPAVTRKQYLCQSMKLTEGQADELMLRDEGEDTQWGQQLRSTFCLADVFIAMKKEERSTLDAQEQLGRFLDLLFGTRIISPTKDEYGMSLAHAAGLRSTDLSRQVGATLLNENGDVLALGTNEVPAYGGGQYWGGPADARDYVLKFDSNERMKRDIVKELLQHLYEGWEELPGNEKDAEMQRIVNTLESTRVMNLTEFGRAVHAEMEAILSAARRGVAIKGAILYTTTFPCHNCAKHIVGAGVERVVYVEPYPKSLARELHKDAIGFEEDGPVSGRVRFESFVGVAPRRYPVLFSSIAEDGRRHRRKKKDGTLETEPLGLRLSASPLSYIDRESVAAVGAKKFGDLTPREEKA